MNPSAILQYEIRTAVALLQAGKTVAFPTETVYGLGADAANPSAVKQIFQIKGRPAAHPLIVHIADISHMESWATDIPAAAWKLAEQFWPGPLTLILPRRSNVPLEVTGGQDTVGLRVPQHPVASALLHAFGGGIAAPSANRFGRISPTTAQHVSEELGTQVGMILDGGACTVGLESTIIKLTDNHPLLMRPGGLSIEAIEQALHQKISHAPPAVPTIRVSGMLDAHYAPVTPLELLPAPILREQALHLAQRGQQVAVLMRGHDSARHNSSGVTTFFMPGSPVEYAHALYAMLHRVDHGDFDHLLIEAPPDTGEWLAINDRLRRAAYGAGR